MMNKHLAYLLLLPVTILVASLFTDASRSQASTCLQLNSDLSYGMSDSSYSESIYFLQEYLQGLGYLTATPNGHFGPATFSAVKTYQNNNNISNTGYIGPLTRSSISQKTCSVVTPITTTSITPATPSPTIVTNSVPVVYNITITSPSTGQVLSIGSTTIIRWSTPMAGNYNISLEQPGGAGAGFIALSQSAGINGNQYVWNVGKIFSSQTNTYQNLVAGTYRIRLQGTATGASPTDKVSGWFTIVASQFAVTSVTPSSAFADNATSVVLFGSGFTSSASIYFDTNYSGLMATNRYVSPDGTVIVFTVPTIVSSGTHTLYINNGQSSSPASLSFVVNSIQ